MGKSTISMAIFNSYVSHNQRVNLHTPLLINGKNSPVLPLKIVRPSLAEFPIAGQVKKVCIRKMCPEFHSNFTWNSKQIGEQDFQDIFIYIYILKKLLYYIILYYNML